jgi:D-aminopeptidase
LLLIHLSKNMRALILVLSLFTAGQPVFSQSSHKPRARDLGIPFQGKPGRYNAITDVAGVTVGYSTIIEGSGAKAVRTGVTAVLPRGNRNSPVYAAWYTLNGNGEMTGTTWVQESGFLETPILITNTHSVGLVRDATLKWLSMNNWYPENKVWWGLPVVAETYDGILNDITGFHVKEQHVFEALSSAGTGAIAEGNVGGGTGMMCLGFKGGTGTSSRAFNIAGKKYTVGALVQSNFGAKEDFTICGVPVGKMLMDTLQYRLYGAPDNYKPGSGSIIVVVGTDAPLLPHQLKRVVQRVSIGVGLVGGKGHNTSGDIFIAFSTANEKAHASDSVALVQQLPNDWIDPVFSATIQSVEEAIINAMVAAETMEGLYGNTAHALPHERVREIMKKYRFDIPEKKPVADKNIRLSAELLNAYQGTYGNMIAEDVQIVSEQGKLYWKTPEHKTELLPVTGDTFVPVESRNRVVFDRQNKSLRVLSGTVEMLYKRK